MEKWVYCRKTLHLFLTQCLSCSKQGGLQKREILAKTYKASGENAIAD
jgi:hypothetical protein